MDAVILETAEDGIVTLTLNKPELRNPISEPDMVDALTAAFARLDRDPGVRAIILTGAGSAFSSGGNLQTMKPGGGLNDPLPIRTRGNYRHGIQRLPLMFEALEVPVIAAVNGPAIGAGCDLACMCDIRIASEQARFAESFVKVGLVPGDGGAWLLPRIVGFAKACEMALTGDPLRAEEALACGLVSRVVPADALLDEAMRIARRIAANPVQATRMTKRLLREASALSLAQTLDVSSALQALLHATRDHEEAVAAMLAKRSPGFTGE